MGTGGANLAFLVLGSNNDAESMLPAAAAALAELGQIRATSQVWETEPVGFREQPNFLNAAVLLATDHSADALKSNLIPRIESALGRVRDPANKNGPRTIDIDLALFNREVIAKHRIPDPDILTQAFVARPLAELCPDFVHPIANKTLADIAATLNDTVIHVRCDLELWRMDV